MKLKARRSNGGHLIHFVEQGKHAALCGYGPSSPKGHLIRGRGRWISTFSEEEIERSRYSVCRKCQAEREKANGNISQGRRAEE